MIYLNVYSYDGAIRWTLVKLRPADQWRALGPRVWERSGEVILDQSPVSDREAISAVLRAVQDRLGER